MPNIFEDTNKALLDVFTEEEVNKGGQERRNINQQITSLKSKMKPMQDKIHALVARKEKAPYHEELKIKDQIKAIRKQIEPIKNQIESLIKRRKQLFKKVTGK